MKITEEAIQDLLDITYELEGLLHLATARAHDIPAAIPGLIDNKIAELSEYFASLKPFRTDAEPSQYQPGLTPAGEPEHPAEPAEPEQPAQPAPAAKPSPAFSLNDRFLFTRELFNGDRSRFDDAVSRLPLMDSYEEAEQFFTDEYGFDLENDTVADFMRIVARYLEA